MREREGESKGGGREEVCKINAELKHAVTYVHIGKSFVL